MIVALSGSTGFVGQALSRKLRERSWDIKVMTCESFQKSDDDFLKEYIDGSDVVINMAGAPVARKWTPAYKQEIMESRVSTTHKISSAIRIAKQKPSVL